MVILEIKLFYDNFDLGQICGMFTPWHFAVMALFALLLWLFLRLSKNITYQGIKKLHLVVAICLTAFEIIKIVLRVCKGQNLDSYLPLYFCSLYIYAIWIAFAKNNFLSRMGFAYITMGGILASLCFTIYPSTSLALYPVWHPACLHSFAYHLTMTYTGILFLWKKYFVPKANDCHKFFVFVAAFCVLAFMINYFFGTNCMFMANAYKLPVLDAILEYNKYLYMLIVVVAQSVAIFWASFGIYKLFDKAKQCRQKKEVEI